MVTTAYSLDPVLPVNIEAERSILGAVLLDNFVYTQAASLLKPEDFSLDSHRRIYGHMVALSESGRPIDYVTLAEELSRNKELEAIGGVAYLTSLTDGLPRVSNIEHYIRIVRDKSMLRALINAANQAIQSAVAQTEPAEEVLATAESALFHLTEQRLGNDFATVKDIVVKQYPDSKNPIGDAIEALYKSNHITGLQTFYDDLDQMTSGLQPADLIIIAARPSMGKTAFALNIAQNVAIRGEKSVGIFSLEMSRESLLMRLLASEARIDSHKLRTGFVALKDKDALREALGRLASAPIYIDDTPGISVSEMRAKARRLQHQHGLDLIIVDYLQLMSGAPMGGGRKYENRTQEVSAISRGLKLLAKDLRVPVISLSQLSRAPETRTGGDHKPQLSDLRESGSIEQDADVVGFIFRPEVYEKDEAKKALLDGEAELIIAKQRNGPTGAVKLTFLKSLTRFESRAADPGDSGFGE